MYVAGCNHASEMRYIGRGVAQLICIQVAEWRRRDWYRCCEVRFTISLEHHHICTWSVHCSQKLFRSCACPS